MYKQSRKSSTKKQKNILCKYSRPTGWAFDYIENKHSLYHRKNCMKKFCKSLRKHAKNIIDFEKKMLLLTKRELKSRQDPIERYICKKIFIKSLEKIKLQKSYGPLPLCL